MGELFWCHSTFQSPLYLTWFFLQLAILDELERIEIALAKNREKQVITCYKEILVLLYCKVKSEFFTNRPSVQQLQCISVFCTIKQLSAFYSPLVWGLVEQQLPQTLTLWAPVSTPGLRSHRKSIQSICKVWARCQIIWFGIHCTNHAAAYPVLHGSQHQILLFHSLQNSIKSCHYFMFKLYFSLDNVFFSIRCMEVIIKQGYKSFFLDWLKI